jgi:hypothetical protein
VILKKLSSDPHWNLIINLVIVQQLYWMCGKIRGAILTLEIDVSLTLWPHLFYIISSWTQRGRDIS